METKEEKYYRTADLPMASFLFAKGIELVNIDKLSDKKRAYFVFVESPIREELTYIYNFVPEDDERASVDARKIIYATKTLKEKLYRDN